MPGLPRRAPGAEPRQQPDRPDRPAVPPTLARPDGDDHSLRAEICRDLLDLVVELGIDLETGECRGAAPPAPEPALSVGPAEVAGAAGAGDAAGAGGAEGLDIRATTAFRLFRATRSVGRAVSRSGAGAGREGRDLLLLEVGRCGVTRPWRVAHRLGIGRSTVTGLVRATQRDGLVRVGRSGRDGRGVTLSLTNQGLEAARRAADAWRGADERLLERFTPAERDELRRLLRKVVQVLARAPRNRKLLL